VIAAGRPGAPGGPTITTPAAATSQSADPVVRKPPPVNTGAWTSAMPMSARMPVDFVTGRRLQLGTGRVLALALTASVEQVYRAQAGFVVVEVETMRRAWFVDEKTGAQALLFDKATWVAVAGDGSGRLAWVSGADMYFRTSVQATGTVRRTDAPPDGGPVGFVGEAVLLADSGTDGGLARHDLWFPARGDYQPTWVDFFAVFGARSDGRELVAAKLSDRKDICLLFANVDGLDVNQSECGLLDQAPMRGWVSPNGRWLVVVDKRGVRVFDLSVKDKPPARQGPVVQDVRADATWIDSDTLALHVADRLVVVPMAGPAHVVEYLLPPDAVIVRQ
jgi:hypothetical protein